MLVRTVPARKRVALVAHDNKKTELLAWAVANREALAQHDLCGTGTTGRLLAEKLGLPVSRFLSGPLGGDQQIGALIAEGSIDVLVFFWDPLEAQPHDPDVKALLRLAVLWNIPCASTPTGADHLFTSPPMTQSYSREVPAAAEATRWPRSGELAPPGPGTQTPSLTNPMQ
ncbi:MAG TPA: methylglyoxal synthase [Urbifossiella sp.]|nr:methylglyoxal synthase [Urbifossiella sp.]